MRVLWVLVMIAGVIFFSGLALALGLASTPEGEISIRDLRLLLLTLLPAGICAAGIFMTPGEFKETMRPVEEEEPPRPAWMDELAQPRKDQD